MIPDLSFLVLSMFVGGSGKHSFSFSFFSFFWVFLSLNEKKKKEKEMKKRILDIEGGKNYAFLACDVKNAIFGVMSDAIDDTKKSTIG
ncbi:MAG: hypothetical protein Q8P67_16865 [archaeon]|nr:hypothetical protein [archaeon]